ncbi:MAG TPA: cysteine desulfurase family protein, partial [Thermoanaerobaculia bacterium]|nr:cysteine desulfurase family protein [Thermoanaerobaculia bacterium]
ELEREGFRVTFVPPDREGLTSAEAVAAALTEKTILVSLMAANNEIGTLNPVGDVARLCKERRVLFHTDAAQAFGKIPLSVHDLGVDLLSVSAHKIYGPKGVGALFVRSSNPRVTLSPLVHGGGHEKGLRSGTLDVPAIVGFSSATRLALLERERDEAHVRFLRDRLWDGIRANVPNALLNGHPTRRLAGNLNVAFEGAESDALLLEMRELAVSTGSACTSASLEPSHVLSGIGLSESLSKSSIRFGLGRYTTREEIDLAVEVVGRAVASVRARSPRAILGEDVPALP